MGKWLIGWKRLATSNTGSRVNKELTLETSGP